MRQKEMKKTQRDASNTRTGAEREGERPNQRKTQSKRETKENEKSCREGAFRTDSNINGISRILRLTHTPREGLENVFRRLKCLLNDRILAPLCPSDRGGVGVSNLIYENQFM